MQKSSTDQVHSGLVNSTVGPIQTERRVQRKLNVLIGSIAMLLTLASVGMADMVTPAEVLSLGLDPGYTWQYDPTVASGLTHYYTLTHTYGTWGQTRTEAQAIDGGGDLVIINSASENTFLTNAFASLAYTQDQATLTTKDPAKNIAWIGLSKPSISSPGTAWTWVDSSTLATVYPGAPLYYRWADGGDPAAQAGDHAYLHLANHPGENGHPGAGFWNANNWHEQGDSAGGTNPNHPLYPMGIVESKVIGNAIPEPATLVTLAAGGLALLRRRSRRENKRPDVIWNS
jgi:hypothetical protein